MSAALDAVRVSPTTLPVIDIGGLWSERPADRRVVGAQLREACLDKGFFYIRNHGIPDDLVRAVFAEAEQFFALPAADKAALDKAHSGVNRGYEPLKGQALEAGAPPDLKEGFYIGPEHALDDPRVRAGKFNHGPNQWPANRPAFRTIMQTYFETMLTLGERLMRGLALSLDLPENRFEAFCTDPMATLRLLHYPPQPANADPARRAPARTPISAASRFFAKARSAGCRSGINPAAAGFTPTPCPGPTWSISAT
jgi:isopenicillin N synthase-like dioxygenase